MNEELSVETIDLASERLRGVVSRTPLWFSERLSREYGADVYLKREDLQQVRSYKIRGAYNLMSSLSDGERKRGVVCASAGNHAQGVALSASLLKTKAVIFMPVITPLQKIARVRSFGGDWIEVKLVGLNYDESSKAAEEYCKEKDSSFVHPFEDYRVMSGQGTVAKEICDEIGEKLDYLICPVGGGGLISGAATYVKERSKHVHVIGVEPAGVPSMYESLKEGRPVTLEKMDTFVEGAAVRRTGKKTFEIIQKKVDKVLLAQEGKVCTTMIELYQNEGIVAEPAGALSIAALDDLSAQIKGKTVVCVLSGGNNDILRYPEVMERSLVYRGLKHYFLIEFAQKPGQLRKFVDSALGPNTDIVRFEYMKKSSKETGPALIGIELTAKEELNPLLERMNDLGINYKRLTSADPLYSYLI
jgi:threonine dehydratase